VGTRHKVRCLTARGKATRRGGRDRAAGQGLGVHKRSGERGQPWQAQHLRQGSDGVQDVR
jgi:hypothetical protein